MREQRYELLQAAATIYASGTSVDNAVHKAYELLNAIAKIETYRNTTRTNLKEVTGNFDRL